MANLTLIPASIVAPSKWLYSYDGETLLQEEEYEDEAITKRTAAIFRELHPDIEVKIKGKRVSVKEKLSQSAAIKSLLEEFLTQARAAGIISLETQAITFAKLNEKESESWRRLQEKFLKPG